MTSTSTIRTQMVDAIAERTTPLITLTLVDEAGDTITSLSTLTLTIHAGGTIINERDGVDILSAFSAGTVSFRLDPEDTQILAPTLRREVHTALLEWSWDSGARRGKHEIIHVVENFATVP